MKYLINLSIAAFLAISLSGCIIVGNGDDGNHDWRSAQKENNEIISDLELNTERKRVLTKLGAPSFSEAFSKNGDEYRILYYRTQHRHSDGDTSIDETTPLIFKNNKLVGWGTDTLAKIEDM